MVLRLIYFAVLAVFLIGCGEQQGSPLANGPTACKGEWAETDSNGLVRRRYKDFWHFGMKTCLTENEALTQWESSLNARFDRGIECTPQTDLPTMWLRSGNSYYT